MEKAKVGDFIQSLHVNGLPERGYLAGKVDKVEVDPRDNVEYVHFTAIWDAGKNDQDQFELEQIEPMEMRTPQNGTRTTFGETMEHILIVKGA